MNSLWRRALLLIFLLSFFLKTNAQTLEPEVQFWVDSIQRWISNAVSAGGTVDTVMLAKLNNKAQTVRDSIAQAKAREPKSSSFGSSLKTKSITKIAMAGSALTVPPNTIWKIKGVYLKNDKDPYRLKVTSIKYDDMYKAGEKINLPLMSSESALMDEGEGTDVTYEVEIEELKLE